MRLLLVFLLPIYLFAQMEFSEPKPSFEEPRLWLIKLNTADVHVVNHTLGGIYNVLKAYPSDTLKIAVVAYGPGMRVLKKDYDAHTLVRIQSLMEYDVEFVACKNTIATMKWTENDFIEDLTYVQAGIAEMIERKFAHWIEVTPYDE
jgi:hypothetical protein